MFKMRFITGANQAQVQLSQKLQVKKKLKIKDDDVVE